MAEEAAIVELDRAGVRLIVSSRALVVGGGVPPVKFFG
jgi:hypothetical protein